jgi:uncharacterized protein YkwD
MAVRAGRFRHAVIGAVILALLLVAAPATPAQALDARRPGRIQTLVERKINNARTARGLAPLKVNAKVEYWSIDHARHMARRGQLEHDSITRLRRESPRRAVAWSENIARNTAANAARRAHRMWMRSPGHRANILNPLTTHMGVGVVKRGGYTYIVQRFTTLH